MQLKNFQINAVNGLLEKSKRLLEIGNKSLILKSPTGSGKTIMIAEFIQKFVQSGINKNKFSFVWFAPQTLHKQSKEKLEKYFRHKNNKMFILENLINKKRFHPTKFFFVIGQV